MLFSQWGLIFRRPSGRRFALKPNPVPAGGHTENNNMQKTDTMPFWVYLAFSSIATRRGALSLIAACVVFSVYCIPWTGFFPQHDWIAQLFLIDDWSWFATMVPITAWYWMSLRWVDSHALWPDGNRIGAAPGDT